MKAATKQQEFFINVIIKASGYSAIFFVLLILYFLLSQGLPALSLVEFDSLLGTRWYPIEE
jgi:ABC-type phosphate transport system permease subunit